MFLGPINFTLNAGVSPTPSGKILKDLSTPILITLQTVIQLAVEHILLACNPGPHANLPALFLGVEGVVEPDLGTGGSESQRSEAVQVQRRGEHRQQSTGTHRRG